LKGSRVEGLKGYVLAGELISALDFERLKAAIPVAKGVDVTALTAGDDSPDRFVYLHLARAGELSGNNRRWTGKPLQRVVDALPMYSYRGHPVAKAGESMPYQDFSTAWIGGAMIGGELYVKGYVPKDEAALKERIRVGLATGKPMQASPWGRISGTRKDGEFVVEDFEPERIDWGAPGTAGFASSGVLALGGELTETEESTMTEKEIAELQTKNTQLGGELKTAQEGLVAATTQVTELKKQVETLGGELKTAKETATAAHQASLKAHKDVLVARLPETEREIGGELLTGDSVEALDKNFDLVCAKLKKARPGMKILGGEVKEEKKEQDGEKDFAG